MVYLIDAVFHWLYVWFLWLYECRISLQSYKKQWIIVALVIQKKFQSICIGPWLFMCWEATIHQHQLFCKCPVFCFITVEVKQHKPFTILMWNWLNWLNCWDVFDFEISYSTVNKMEEDRTEDVVQDSGERNLDCCGSPKQSPKSKQKKKTKSSETLGIESPRKRKGSIFTKLGHKLLQSHKKTSPRDDLEDNLSRSMDS